jgi:thioredoxin reductase (NADPH)
MDDVIIIGGGVSGLSCAIYTSEAGLQTRVLDTDDSQLKSVSRIDNYPGFPDGVSGIDFLALIRQQARKYGTEILYGDVRRVRKDQGMFRVATPLEVFSSRYLVIASNRYTQPAEDLGLLLEVNRLVPSGKIKKVIGSDWTGETSVKNLFVAGLLAGIPSQAVIAAGQGASVGMAIVSRELGKAHVWHNH